MTEIYRFISNLALKYVFGNNLIFEVELHNMQNRSLIFLDPMREIGDYRCQVNEIKYSDAYSKDDIIGKPNEYAVLRTRWIFQRFNWLSKSVVDLIKNEQEPFVRGKVRI